MCRKFVQKNVSYFFETLEFFSEFWNFFSIFFLSVTQIFLNFTLLENVSQVFWKYCKMFPYSKISPRILEY